MNQNQNQESKASEIITDPKKIFKVDRVKDPTNTNFNLDGCGHPIYNLELKLNIEANTDFSDPINLRNYFQRYLGYIVDSVRKIRDHCEPVEQNLNYIENMAIELDEFAEAITDYKNEKVPVEDILKILDYSIYDERKSYKEYPPKERKNHIYLHLKKVQDWICEQYPKEVKEWNKKIRKQFKTITEVKK